MLFALLLASIGQAAGKDVRIGVFAYQGERAAASDWSPVIDYLRQALPEHQFRLENYDTQGLRQAIAEQRVDLVITNPGNLRSRSRTNTP